MSEKGRQNVTESVRKRDLRGSKNPFYGRSHSVESRAKMSAANTGDKHHGWKNGASTLPYGPGFTKRFKRLIRDRDNHTCQRCGKTRGQVGRTLQVHHADHDKMNNDPTNLVTVCASCNVWLSYHRDVLIRSATHHPSTVFVAPDVSPSSPVPRIQ